MRKLVTCRKITAIYPIKNADKIEEICIDGWSIVAQKGIHSEGDVVVFFEIDSFLPENDERFESFMQFGVKQFNNVRGHRVKTKKLRGVYSQGVIIPISEFPEIKVDFDKDFADEVGVVKWEKSEVTGYTGDTKGTFPGFLIKSDQDRIQNVYGKLVRDYADEIFVGTLKMDGSSVTVFYDESGDELGICSRNQQLKLDMEQPLDQQGKFIEGASRSGLFDKVMKLNRIYGGSWAIQGELVGHGIQGNFEKFDQYQVFTYNIFDIDNHQFVNYTDFALMSDKVELDCVPVIYDDCEILKEEMPKIIKMADGKGLRCSYREGIVWKQVYGNKQFKAISNKYLDKEE